jgi:U3 small nucleolar RNA-associated protein 10
MFVGYAITPASSTDISKGDNATTDLISLLVDHATIKGDSNVSDIVSVPQQTTSKVMNAIGATDFLNGTLAMLQSDETMVGSHFPYEILSHLVSSSRLVLLKSLQTGYPRLQKLSVANNRRLLHQFSTAFGTSRQSAGVLVTSALNALKAIGSSICPGEESALVSTVISVIKTIKTRASLQTAIAVLPCYVYVAFLPLRSTLLRNL